MAVAPTNAVTRMIKITNQGASLHSYHALVAALRRRTRVSGFTFEVSHSWLRSTRNLGTLSHPSGS